MLTWVWESSVEFGNHLHIGGQNYEIHIFIKLDINIWINFNSFEYDVMQESVELSYQAQEDYLNS
jgi:hypothetical protein